MDWDPDVLGKPLSSTMIGIHTNGVIEDIHEKSKIILSQNQFTDDESKYWKYDTPLANVFNGYHSMELKDNVTPHKHQLEVIEKIHDRINKKIHSATIQSPCASGKSLLSLLLISEMMQATGASALYVTINSTAAMQVVNQACTFFDITKEDILILDGSEACKPYDLLTMKYKIVIGTYQLLTSSGRAEDADDYFKFLCSILSFGMVIMDEAHYSAAHNYKNIYKINAPVKIGVTATVKRMDKELVHLLECTGPLKITISRDDLVTRNIIPNVSLFEIHIDEDEPSKRLISSRKLEVFYKLVLHHMHKRNSAIAFFETIDELEKTHTLFEKLLASNNMQHVLMPLMKGQTSSNDRIDLITLFRQKVSNNEPVLMFMSPVGNAAYDFLCEVAFQIRCSCASGPIAAQRIGRVQRYINKTTQHVSYTFVSTNTSELKHAKQRRDYLALDNYKTTFINTSSNQSKLFPTEQVLIDSYISSIMVKNKRQRPVSSKTDSHTQKTKGLSKIQKIIRKSKTYVRN